jgi:3-phosphoglycerate kinase
MSIGFCIAHELKQLHPFKMSRQSTLILGGNKGDEKLALISRIPTITHLFLLPLVSHLEIATKRGCVIKKFSNTAELLSESLFILEPSIPLILNGVTPYGDTFNFDAFVELLKKRTGKTLICGGNTVAALRHVVPRATFSTGGGSTLSYLADDRLPALQALNHD